MKSAGDRLVERYLKSLKHELRDLPRARRRELVEEIEGHIVEARAGLGDETEAEVRTLLDRLGDPADIATEARARFGIAQRQGGVLEIFALIGLLIGGLVIPVVGWFVGVALLWGSRAWTTREKLLGTLVVPGGLGTSFLVIFVGALNSVQMCGPVTTDPVTGAVHDPCADETSLVWDVLIAGFFIFLLVAPVVTIAYLAYRLRRPALSSVAPLAP